MLGVGEGAPKKTVKSSALPTMPTGHAQTRRRIPPSAEAKPKRLPMISRRGSARRRCELGVEEALQAVTGGPPGSDVLVGVRA